MIERFINSGGTISELLKSIKCGDKITVFGCDLDAKLALLKESGKGIFFVTHDAKDAVAVKEKLSESGFRCEMLTDKLNFKLSPFEVDYNKKVVDVLCKVVSGQVDAVVANPMFLHYILPRIDWLKSRMLSIERGQALDIDELRNTLINMGFKYSQSPIENEFCVKGEVVDIATSEKCVRVYFDFDEVSSIKEYNKDTLLNTENMEEFVIHPANFLEGAESAIDKCSDAEILDTLNSCYSKLNNMMWCMPYATNIGSTMMDYISDNFVIAYNDTKMTTNYIKEEIEAYNKIVDEEFHDNKFYISEKIDYGKIPVVGFQYITNQNKLFNYNKVFNIKSVPVSNYVGNSKLLVMDLKQARLRNYTAVIYTGDKNGLSKIEGILSANGVAYNKCNSALNIAKDCINIVASRSGINANFESEKILIISNLNVLGRNKKQPQNVVQNTETIDFLPKSGDFVVHSTHGVGICLGVECLKLSSAKRDYVIIEYKNKDRLYLPVESIDLIDKYVGEDKPPLNKLGGTDFVKTKERVRKNIKELAFNLAKLYAERESLQGYKYPSDDELMLEFEESFGYNETPDQAQAIADIKADMMKGRVMDRLVCGDVGFGKTEVALRGAFKTILAGKQVAFLCPTTILSQQHFNTAMYRMKKFGVNIRVLNRFCSAKEINEICSGVASGEIDMLVGTHKLLNDKVKFKNLGLLILDEEQKFGVGDKEKIKNLKKNVNVLTLSATPIPRTLNMSLVGIRDISVIETPPVSRIPTAVKVCEYSQDIVNIAISEELERGGQILIIYNKVESIYEYASKIKTAFPNVEIDVAHGQMAQDKLEDAIYKLYNNQTQILVSTTLIENGVDLPNANTLIVVNADMLGLSQLYQLKGRVGRSDRQAFALFLYDGNRFLTDTALKRLQAITEYTAMGSGFKIALKDLEIRGAGSIFGGEQSGHIEKVGYAMYLKLLQQEIGDIKGEKHHEKGDVKIETTLNAFIPNDYIYDYNQRMSAYLKISKIDSYEKLNKVVLSLGEVYGDMPEEVNNLCIVALIKNLAEKCGISRVVLKPRDCKFVLAGEILQNLNNAINQFSQYVVLDVKEKPIITIQNIVNLKECANLMINFLEFVCN